MSHAALRAPARATATPGAGSLVAPHELQLPGGWLWQAHAVLGSTQTFATMLAEQGAPERIAVTAERQTAGRGRHGRVWTGGEGNLATSLILRPAVPLQRWPELAFVAALSVHDTLRALLPVSVPLMLKWPNDVLAGGAKLAGILIEPAGGAAIVGIGLNLKTAPSVPGANTGAVAGLTGAAAPTPQAALEGLLAALDRWRAVWEGAGFPAIRAAWLERGPALAQPLTVTRPDGQRIDGTFAGLAEDGALLLGSGERIAAGTVDLQSEPRQAPCCS